MKINEEFVKSKVNGQWIAVPIGELSIKCKAVVKLNETANEIWDSIAGGKTLEEIAVSFTEEYDVTKEKAMESIKNIVSEMQKNGIIINE